jgi:zinc protease
MMMRLALGLALSLLALTARAEVQIQQVTSPGGIHAWLVEEHSIPFTALEIRMRPGAAVDEPGKRGAVNLMVALLEEGSGEMDARAFAEAREALAASYGFDVGDDSVSISATMLTENRDAAVDLLRQALVAPRFEQDAIDRVRGQVLSIIQSDSVEPNAISANTFYSLAFPDHPYGSDQNGTVESVVSLTRDDMLAAHRAVLTRQEVYVGAVGDITPAELGALLDHLLGDLPADGPDMPAHVDYTLPAGTDVVDFDTPQSVVLFGQKGITRDDPRYFAASILNTVLGDGMESRLMQSVREERGLTYGIGTFLVPRDMSEMILGSFASSNASVAEAIGLVQEEWARIAAEGITQEELDFAKTYMTGEYPLRFDGNGQIASILVGMQMIDLPPEYVIHRNDYVNAVTLEEANRVAAEIYDPEGLRFVVVGRPDGLE